MASKKLQSNKSTPQKDNNSFSRFPEGMVLPSIVFHAFPERRQPFFAGASPTIRISPLFPKCIVWFLNFSTAFPQTEQPAISFSKNLCPSLQRLVSHSEVGILHEDFPICVLNICNGYGRKKLFRCNIYSHPINIVPIVAD